MDHSVNNIGYKVRIIENPTFDQQVAALDQKIQAVITNNLLDISRWKVEVAGVPDKVIEKVSETIEMGNFLETSTYFFKTRINPKYNRYLPISSQETASSFYSFENMKKLSNGTFENQVYDLHQKIRKKLTELHLDKTVYDYSRTNDKHKETSIDNEWSIEAYGFMYVAILQVADTINKTPHLCARTNSDNIYIKFQKEKYEFAISTFDPFYSKKNIEKLMLSDQKTTKHRHSLTKYLEEQGLIGLPDDLDETFAPLILAQGPLAQEVKDRGIGMEKGIILYGPPGTGKTSFANHLSQYLGCDPKHVTYTAATKLIHSSVGQTEKNIRALFEPAKVSAKKFGADSPLYIVFIDELDSIAGKRSNARNSWESSQVAELLTCMDGHDKSDNILVIATTNNLSMIDPALLRTGRFGIQIQIGFPNLQNRVKIIDFYLKTLSKNGLLDETVCSKKIAEKTENFSGADLKGLVDAVNDTSLARFIETLNSPDKCESEGKITWNDFKIEISKRSLK